MRIYALGLAVLLTAVGCGASEEKPAEGGDSFSFEGFGVEVKSGPDGTTWKAPGTEGSVKDGKVDVDAPGTDVGVDLNTGETDVKAPGTSVKVE